MLGPPGRTGTGMDADKRRQITISLVVVYVLTSGLYGLVTGQSLLQLGGTLLVTVPIVVLAIWGGFRLGDRIRDRRAGG